MNYPDIDPIALSIFGQINIHWYALTYLAAFFLCWRIMKATRGTGDRAWSDQQISDLLSAGMVGVILGGRIGYVLFYGFDAFISNPLVLFRIWEGGMSFHGGLLGVIVALWVYANRTGRGFFSVTDFVVLGGHSVVGLDVVSFGRDVVSCCCCLLRGEVKHLGGSARALRLLGCVVWGAARYVSHHILW